MTIFFTARCISILSSGHSIGFDLIFQKFTTQSIILCCFFVPKFIASPRGPDAIPTCPAGVLHWLLCPAHLLLATRSAPLTYMGSSSIHTWALLPGRQTARPHKTCECAPAAVCSSVRVFLGCVQSQALDSVPLLSTVVLKIRPSFSPTSGFLFCHTKRQFEPPSPVSSAQSKLIGDFFGGALMKVLNALNWPR